jgi:[ribosomal protein S5]-alanine N-acetyltransferase
MKLQDHEILLRPLEMSDKFELAITANNPNIAKNLRDAFPNPYTLADAEFFIENIANNSANHIFGIFYEGKYCGNIGIHPGSDVYCKTAELGYFLGEKYWGKGITTRAVKLIADFTFNQLDIVRIYAGIFEYNPASMKVLEKNGFKLEGILRKSVFKNNQYYDEYRYGLVHPDLL